MSFLFAYLGSLNTPHGWPIQLMHRTETAFIAAAVICLLLAIVSRGRGPEVWRIVVASLGGLSASLSLLMPVELAPFFFDARGEWMMATIWLNLAYLPVAAVFVLVLLKLMKVD